MLLQHLLETDNHHIDEALGKWGTLAAMGMAGVGGIAALTGNSPHPTSTSQDVRPISTAQAASAPQRSQPVAGAAVTPGVHANFPRELEGAGSMTPKARVEAFQNALLPLIRAENQSIINNRSRVRTIISSRLPSPQDQAWLNQKIEDYGAQNATDLLKRMDVIPASLVLAQSAIESGWGTDQIARSGNAFFGQRAVRDQRHTQGPQGERYRSYDSPQHSIRSYMRNLNTHRAYQALRDQRARLRSQGKTPSGMDLATGLQSYSTRGAEYVDQVQRLIRSRDLSRFDRS